MISSAGKSPKAIAQKFLNYVVANQPDEAYKLTNNGFKFAQTASDWKFTVDGMHQVFVQKPKEVSEKKTDDTLTQVTFKELGTDNKTYTIVVDVRLVTGDKTSTWQVEQFTSAVDQ
jgi:hypothetical protein